MTAGSVTTRGVRTFLRSLPLEVYPLGAVLSFAVCYGIGQSVYKFQSDQNLRKFPTYYHRK